MLPTIKNLVLIADAAEYFDKKCGSAWRIKSNIENAAVWAAHGLICARKADDRRRELQAMAALATIRTWIRECNKSSFAINITPDAVAKTLGLDRAPDVHEEACKIARNHCIRSRSAADFKRYYANARAALEDRMVTKTENIGPIVELLQQAVFVHPVSRQEVADDELYDEEVVERQTESLNECVGKVLELLELTCASEIDEAVTAGKRARLISYQEGVRAMMEIVGIDGGDIANRQARLEAQISAQIEGMNVDIDDETVA